MSNVPRMRTLPEAVREIKKLDENSALTLTALRRMVNKGEIPCIHVASKRLICLDTLLEQLQHPAQPEQSAEKYGVIRGNRV
ncbi:MAG: DNA-binding protein [Candidatus Fimenecus sp.]